MEILIFQIRIQPKMDLIRKPAYLYSQLDYLRVDNEAGATFLALIRNLGIPVIKNKILKGDVQPSLNDRDRPNVVVAQDVL